MLEDKHTAKLLDEQLIRLTSLFGEQLKKALEAKPMTQKSLPH